MNHDLSIGEIIQLKLAKLLVNVDDYLRSNDSGIISKTASTDGLILASTSMTIGYLGILSSMGNSLPFLSTVSEIANYTVATFFNTKLTLAETIGLTGATIGLELAVIGKFYKETMGPLRKDVSGYFDCVLLNGKESIEPRTKVLKSIENETFKNYYKAIRVSKKIGYEDLKPKYIEDAVKIPYYLKSFSDSNASVFYSQNENEEIEIIRRICFKESKNNESAQLIFKRINKIINEPSVDNITEKSKILKIK